MKKLEDIPKHNYFEAPAGYFDSLPMQIQARVEKQEVDHTKTTARAAWQYALPVLVLATIGMFWFANRSNKTSAEVLLANIETEELVNYLAEVELTYYEDLKEENELSSDEATAVEQAVYNQQWLDANMDELLNELDINSL